MVQEARKALAAGFAVVIGLQSTGEAAVDALNMQPGDECCWVSTTCEMLLRFVEVHFPTRREVPRANAKRARRCLALPSITPISKHFQLLQSASFMAAVDGHMGKPS